jgi:hypothetical protein
VFDIFLLGSTKRLLQKKKKSNILLEIIKVHTNPDRVQQGGICLICLNKCLNSSSPTWSNNSKEQVYLFGYVPKQLEPHLFKLSEYIYSHPLNLPFFHMRLLFFFFNERFKYFIWDYGSVFKLNFGNISMNFKNIFAEFFFLIDLVFVQYSFVYFFFKVTDFL